MVLSALFKNINTYSIYITILTDAFSYVNEIKQSILFCMGLYKQKMKNAKWKT